MSNENANSGGVSFLGLLGILFIGLKLGGVIDWSWWYVTMPLWIGLALLAVVLAVWGCIAIVSKIWKAH